MTTLVQLSEMLEKNHEYYTYMAKARQVPSVAQLVATLHRNCRATGLNPAKGPIVAFFATAPG
jgi:hypothetical protein